MAKVSITIDTEDKSVSVKVGKKVLENVSNIWINTEDEGGFFSLDITQLGDVDGLRQVTSLRASVNDEEWQEVEAKVDTKELSRLLRPLKT